METTIEERDTVFYVVGGSTDEWIDLAGPFQTWKAARLWFEKNAGSDWQFTVWSTHHVYNPAPVAKKARLSASEKR
jgi:hypothetical protein